MLRLIVNRFTTLTTRSFGKIRGDKWKGNDRLYLTTFRVQDEAHGIIKFNSTRRVENCRSRSKTGCDQHLARPTLNTRSILYAGGSLERNLLFRVSPRAGDSASESRLEATNILSSLHDSRRPVQRDERFLAARKEKKEGKD